MKNFLLNQNYGLTIELFSKYHLILILTTFLIVGLIINNKELFINISNKKKRIFQIGLASLLLINFIIRRGSFVYYGVYDWHNHMDINFCNFTSIMFIIYGLSGNKKIYNLCFYMTFIGPLIAIICPSVNISPLNYSFYSFIILHHIVFIFNIMFMYIEKKTLIKKDVLNAIHFIIIYHLIIYIFNLFTGTSYNETMTFVNGIIQQNNLISVLAKYSIITFLFHFIIETLLLGLANFVLKKLMKKS